jgi:hypothetical protein
MSEIRMPMTALAPGGRQYRASAWAWPRSAGPPTSPGRADDLPGRSVAGLRSRTLAMLDAAIMNPGLARRRIGGEWVVWQA